MVIAASELIQTVILNPTASEIVWAALYVRISQDPEGLEKGVRRQVNNGLEQLRAAGATHVDIYSDNDISASRYSQKRRDRYFDLLEGIEEGKYQIVAVRMEDRMHRQVIELAKFLQICEKAGVTRFLSGMGEYNLADHGQRTMLYIKAALAEAEIEQMRLRQRDAQAELAMQGKPRRGGWRAFGEPGVGKHVADPDPEIAKQIAERERALIRQAVTDIIKWNRANWSIVREWNKKKIRTTTNKPWSPQPFRRMLVSPRMIGMREYKGKLYPFPGPNYEPILDKPTWHAIRERMLDPERNIKGAVPAHLLTGLVFCGLCGQRMGVEWRMIGKKPGNPRMRYYRCRRQASGKGCGQLSCSAEPLERLIVEALFVAVESPDFYELGSPDGNPAQALYERKVSLNALIERIEDKVAREVISEEAGTRNIRQVMNEIANVDRELAKLNGNTVKLNMPRNIRQVWPDFKLDRQRIILAAVFEEIAIHPQERGPFDPKKVEIRKWRA
ncbi:MAG TPA: recombinase family protein [Candidatus Binatia bacterium]|nr:recombinase family protein [Candidatus Binatia bacterium]